METEERAKPNKKAAAESFASLSIGLWAVSIIGYLTSGNSWTIYLLAVVGLISALLGIYLIMPSRWKQESVLEYLERSKIIGVVKLLVWLLVLLTFGVRLVQSKIIWLIILGLLTNIIAFAVFLVGLWRIEPSQRVGKVH